MKVICLILLSLAAVITAEYANEDGVVILTDSNFDQALREFEFSLIEFYAPWCGHCKRLTPEYADAAQQLAQSHPEVKLCKVDATVENTVAEKFDIQGFPTLKFFKKGGEPIEYNGGRTASEIVNWIRKKTGASSVEVTSLDDAQKAITDNEAVVLFVGLPTSTEYAAYVSVAAAFDDVLFINSNVEEIRAKYGASSGESIVVFSNFGEEKNTLSDSINAENVRKFVDSNRFPTVMPFNQGSAQRIFGENIDAIFLIRAPNQVGKAAEEAFKSVASQLKGKIAFSLANIEEDLGGRLAEYIGVTEDDIPAVRIVQPSQNMKKFVFSSEITAENLIRFINDFNGNTLEPFFKSEPVPAESYEGNVRVVVGKNFKQIVLDNTKNVLVEFYAPWCGHCKSLAPIYESVAARYRNVEDLVLAKMDAVANEVDGVAIEGFPTLFFYPKNQKSSPIEFEDERTEEGFANFLQTHAGVQGGNASGRQDEKLRNIEL